MNCRALSISIPFYIVWTTYCGGDTLAFAELGEEWIAMCLHFLDFLTMMFWAFNVRATNCLPACLPFFYWGLFEAPIFNSTYAQKAFFPINSPDDDDDASSGQQSQVSSKLYATSSQTDGVQNAWACNMLASWLVQRTSSNRSTVDIAKTRRQINTEHLQNNPAQD